ncbi:MAG: DNA alkylation repair protein [Saprospiraceae bacterium]
MAEPLKYVYNEKFISDLAKAIRSNDKSFDINGFTKDVFDNSWSKLELKDRMRHIALMIDHHLNYEYEQNVNILKSTLELLITNDKKDGFKYMLFPDYIEVFGLEYYDISIQAFEEITQFTSCEFAVRPFILKYKSKMIDQMKKWSTHSHYNVRRLATEGCRPRLPWAMGLPSLKKDPNPILSILDNLKQDNSETVRRSVANNINDISKDNPQIALAMISKWKGLSHETDKLVKHASRTLLKQGNQTAMQLFGFGNTKNIAINNFNIINHHIKIGDYLEFNFDIQNTSNLPSLIRLEYNIYYQKANGTLSNKVYKISEKSYPKNTTITVNRRQHFKIISTRKLHTGLHQLSIIVNGKEFEKVDFHLNK